MDRVIEDDLLNPCEQMKLLVIVVIEFCCELKQREIVGYYRFT